MIARSTEAQPDSFGARSLDRPDRFPFGLQPFEFGRRNFPVARFGERFRLHAERVFEGEVSCPHGFSLGKVLMSPREKPIARRAKTLPDGLFLAARDWTDCLPF